EVILRGTPGHGFLPAIAMTAPAPGGRGRRPEAGRGGVYRHTWRMETGEGAGPLPVSLSPYGDSHHGPPQGKSPGKSRIRHQLHRETSTK
ncbi:MAG: hypothetical protein LLF90_10575, partial [Methanomicrobiaceae archaeon]|uniref:hypothetical protein n=1 Tax=Methanoculleus sp. TaxID=90427 RepID=UPI00320E642D|nr:hypothetical protein [Methanomicrobiaceae archaeon]